MASLKSGFEEIFISYKDVKEANPGWTDKMVEDYLALKRDVATVADTTDTIITVVETSSNNNVLAALNALQQQVGSGDVFSCDDNGFTCDATVFSCDMTEA